MIERKQKRMSGSTRNEFWQNECELYSKRGGNLQSFCENRQIKYSTFAYWRQRLGLRGAKKNSDSIEVPVLRPILKKVTTANSIQIEVDNFCLKFEAGVDPNFVASVLVAMRAGQC